jgi:hypothetical protein
MALGDILGFPKLYFLDAIPQPGDNLVRMDGHEIVGRYLIDYHPMKVILPDQMSSRLLAFFLREWLKPPIPEIFCVERSRHTLLHVLSHRLMRAEQDRDLTCLTEPDQAEPICKHLVVNMPLTIVDGVQP